VKKLRLLFETDDLVKRLFTREQLLDAVQMNMLLQSVDLRFNDLLDNDKEEDEEFHSILDRLCERNQKLQALDEADTMPLYVWPYVFHLANFYGGADMLYRLLCQNVGYMSKSWHCPPKQHKKLGHDCPKSGHGPPNKREKFGNGCPESGHCIPKEQEKFASKCQESKDFPPKKQEEFGHDVPESGHYPPKNQEKLGGECPESGQCPPKTQEEFGHECPEIGHCQPKNEEEFGYDCPENGHCPPKQQETFGSESPESAHRPPKNQEEFGLECPGSGHCPPKKQQKSGLASTQSCVSVAVERKKQWKALFSCFRQQNASQSNMRNSNT